MRHQLDDKDFMMLINNIWNCRQQKTTDIVVYEWQYYPRRVINEIKGNKRSFLFQFILEIRVTNKSF